MRSGRMDQEARRHIMAELIVLGFPRMETADKIVPELAVLNREGLIDLADWARVIRHEDGRVDERQGTCTTSAGAVSGALWGMLFGLLILSPIASALIGSVTGALIGK